MWIIDHCKLINIISRIVILWNPQLQASNLVKECEDDHDVQVRLPHFFSHGIIMAQMWMDRELFRNVASSSFSPASGTIFL